MTLSVYGSLIGYIFLRTLSLLHHPAPLLVSAASTTPTSAQWHRHLGHLSGSSISTLVGSGVLGPISSDIALHCTSCKLGKQLQLQIPLVILCHSVLLISFTLMYGGLLSSLRKEAIITMSYLLMIIHGLPGSILYPLVHLSAVLHYDSHLV